MAGFLGEHVELAAEEEDSDAVAGERAEATRIGFDGLDLAVEAFGGGITFGGGGPGGPDSANPYKQRQPV